ncbi:carboxypeptidase-like regulatory domain-containing protein [Aquimarina sp. U1-2]|uniref:carboxypeptidase-like regulatory domain-containing protein n=1 Tax=Aquimarina sp. U1-2 TaxID=2823141 RepID=UPI001AEC732B|nr:carboxypeptidase-like regulatory domain-containing protein [Aquimarina sp. U1-2]MBP2832364.1 carboxypeptidase-like regulatory domain-containing protein [Aquimarina sp. U1-2]
MSAQKLSSFIILVAVVMLTNLCTVYGQSSVKKEIVGYVTHNNYPLANVNVSVKYGDRKTITDSMGQYVIRASEREYLLYTHIGMQPIEVMVEDVTDFLNIKMRKADNQLDEVLVNNTKKRNSISLNNKERFKVTTAYGELNKRSLSNAYQIIEQKDLWLGSTNIMDALRNQLIGSRIILDKTTQLPIGLQIRPPTSNNVTMALWDIDGMIFSKDPPHVDLVDIDYVAILRSIAATTLYGMRGAGGVIVVRTKGNSRANARKQLLSVADQKKYENDALPFRNSYVNTEHVKKLMNVPKKELYKTYQKMESLTSKNPPSFYLDVANYFKQEQKNIKLALSVLEDLKVVYHEHPEALKSLAYTYEQFGEWEKAIDIYYRVAYLRASYSQSFRDLANAYVKNKQYEEGWDMYLRYLQRGNQLKEKGIEQIVYNEMQFVYSQKKALAKIKEKFIPKSKKEDKESDIRVVFEWNTTEAEFALEFVDPDLNAFTYENSLAKNSERIADQKEKGYSSEEFFIHDMKNGNWLVNLTYLGNKKYQPTYLKATVYKNWGRDNQTQEVKVFKLSDIGNKMQLYAFNSSLSSALSYTNQRF